MKKIFALIIALLMIVSLVACGDKAPDDNSKVSEHLLYDFKSISDKTAQEIADALLENDVLPFVGISMPIEEGYLAGFENGEIKGFDEGVMFGPTINTIPFIGYVFDLSEDTDPEKFINDLEENVNLRWNVCTEADEMAVEQKGDKVVVVLTPEKFEEPESVDENGNPVEDNVPVIVGEEDGDEVFEEFTD